MPEQPDEDSARAVQKRLQPFLDCISYLMARRWLREQRESTEAPSQPKAMTTDQPSSEKCGLPGA